MKPSGRRCSAQLLYGLVVVCEMTNFADGRRRRSEFGRRVNWRKAFSRYNRRREPVLGMVELWSAFLSCDARDMCRIGPALARNLLAWLAFALRPVTLWVAMLPLGFCMGVASDMYWGTRQDHPDYLAFKLLRDEADQIHEAWRRGELSDGGARRAASALADKLLRWDERTDHGISLFARGELWGVELQVVRNQECPPFHAYNGRFSLLERQEKVGNDVLFCEYLAFVH
jgi:hypothetical protein